MNGPTQSDVQEVVFNFTQRCFIGAVPRARKTAEDDRWVRALLNSADSLTPADVASWASGKQRALYELLEAAIIMLGLDPKATFDSDELKGSSAESLSQPLLCGLATCRSPISG